MRIAIDLQGLQSEGSKTRGIGRYSKEIILSVINENPDNHYIIVLNGILPDINEDFKNKVQSDNVQYFKWYAPSPFNYLSQNKVRITIAMCLRSYAFNILDVDMILITSFFEGFSDNILTDLDLETIDIPIVSIFYDLIPLIYSNIYLKTNQDFSDYYYSKLNLLNQFDGLLAISESSAAEALKYLDFDKSRVFNISSACNMNVFNSELINIKGLKIDIDSLSPYILYSGASDPRKNVEGLIKAYAEISYEIQSKYKLVLAGKLLKPELALIREWIINCNIDPSNVIILGYVSDNDLVALYRNCSLFIFPSFHEGFGLPILEAMCCGAPVIGSNNTSISEIISEKNALFDPKNILEMSKLIEKSLTDINYKKLLLLNGDKQKKRFSWKRSGNLALNALNILCSDRSNINKSSNWKEFKHANQYYFNKLLSRISFYNNKLDDELLAEISASIDLIDIQTEKIYRSFFPTKRNGLSWRIEGPFDSNYSLAILNRFYCEALYRSNIKLSIHITEGFGDYKPNSSFLKNFPLINDIYEQSNSLELDCDVISRNLYPPRVMDMDARLNLIHSYGWEESAFPDEWVHDFNRYLQGISVMSVFVQKILIDNGVKIPIKVTGLGLDHIEKINADEDFIIEAKSYKILHISSCFPRKAIDILVNAYCKNFDCNDDVSLIIKTFDNPHNNIDQILEENRSKNPLFPDVKVIKDDLNLSQIKSLYLQSDVLVAPSRGEGFGLPLGEAMILGVPVITTGWGGHTDFCNSENSWLIDYQFSKSVTHFALDMSYWSEPSTDHLAYLIKKVFNSSQLEIIKKTQLAKSQIKKYTWDNVAKENLCFTDQIRFLDVTKTRKIGCITTWNTKCGIASYSKNLFQSMIEPITIFSAYNEDNNIEKSTNLYPSWNLDSSGNQNLNTLSKLIIEAKISTLIIQFNYGFFDFKQLSNLILDLSKNKINIILIFHSTNDPSGDDSKQLSILTKTLKVCTRLFVHSINDLNRLKQIGIVDNVTLFPHGIIDFKPGISKNINTVLSRLDFTKPRRSIASYGFCLPNKGFKELIYAIKILKDRKFDIQLNLYCAIYSDQYSSYYQILVSLIKELNLSDIIKINGEYLSDEESLYLLSKNDLIVFPYQNTTESSSASVRHGLASLKPVLVTPNHIFDDISSCVQYMSGFSPAEIADSIYKWFRKIDINKDHSSENVHFNYKIINQRNFSTLSQRLSNIIESLEIN